MKTRVFRENDYKEAATLIRDGKNVVFPTETVYGLGASMEHPQALKNIYLAKGRPSDNPLILHISDAKGLWDLADGSQAGVAALTQAFWPGPFTLVLPRKLAVPDLVTAGLDTVAIRVPELDLARDFLESCGVPVAAPSANISGRPSPTSFSMAMEGMSGRVEGILMGPDCPKGLESTILEVRDAQYRILRPGSVTPAQIREVLNLSQDYPLLPKILDDTRALAPGMKHRHYQPDTPVKLIRTDTFQKARPFQANAGKILYIGVERPPTGWFEKQWIYSTWEEYARELYRAFRSCDEMGLDLILAQAPEAGEGIEPALANRLLKASGGEYLGEQD